MAPATPLELAARAALPLASRQTNPNKTTRGCDVMVGHSLLLVHHQVKGGRPRGRHRGEQIGEHRAAAAPVRSERGGVRSSKGWVIAADHLVQAAPAAPRQSRRSGRIADREGDEAGDHDLADHVETDRKSTRLNSSHLVISYAVFCLKKKK